MSTASFPSPAMHSGFCSIPHRPKPQLQQLRSNIHIIPLTSKGNKASKIILLVLSSQQRHTDRLQLKFQNEAELPDSYNFLWEMASEWNRETHPESPARERKREFAALHSHCQLLWATPHMWSCQVTVSADVLLFHEHLGRKMKL